MCANNSDTNLLFSSDFSYSEECVSVSFRIDFYSRKGFIAQFQKVASPIISDVFSERMISEEEAHRIDIESVAANLENSANEVMEGKAFIFRWEDKSSDYGENIVQVIVSPYFIFVYCRGDQEINNSIVERYRIITSYMKQLEKEISIVGIRFSPSFRILVEEGYFPFFGLNFYNPRNIPNSAQSHQLIFTDSESQDSKRICKVVSYLDYYLLEEDLSPLGEVNLHINAYSLISCAEEECLNEEFTKLISLTEKYIRLCAK